MTQTGALGSGNVDLGLNAALTFDGVDATAGSRTINHNSSTNQLGTNTGTYFYNGASAGAATFNNNALGAYLWIDASTAGSATINNNVGRTYFVNGSTAGAATITNNGGPIYFRDTASADNARIANIAGTVDISEATAGTSIGSLSGAGNVLLGSNQLTVGNPNLADTISGQISGSGALVKTGTGSLTLAGANTYTGSTTISGGMLQLGNGGTTGSVLGNIANNGTLAINRSDNFSLGAVVSGSGQLQHVGSGTTILTAGNSYTGGTSLDAGTLQVSNDGNLGNASGGLSFNGGTLHTTGAPFVSSRNVLSVGNVTIVSDKDLNMGGIFNGSGNLQVTSSGAITLTNASNDFHGLVKLTGVTTQITDANALTLGTLATGALTAVSTGALNLGSGNIGADLSATSNGGAISQSGALAVSGASTLNAGAGAITLTNAANNFIGAVSATGNGVSITIAGDLNVATLANGAVNLIACGNLNLPVGAIAAGTSDLTLAANGGALTTSGNLSGANVSLTGRVSVTLVDSVTASGAVNLNSSAGAISQPSGVVPATTLTGSSVGDTTLNAANQIITLGNFSAANFSLKNNGALTVAGTLSAGNVAIDVSNATTLVTGAIHASGATGTTVNAGTLQIGNGGTFGEITGNVVDNAVLAFNRSDAVTLASAVSGTGLLRQADSGTLTLTGANSYRGGTELKTGVRCRSATTLRWARARCRWTRARRWALPPTVCSWPTALFSPAPTTLSSTPVALPPPWPARSPAAAR